MCNEPTRWVLRLSTASLQGGSHARAAIIARTTTDSTIAGSANRADPDTAAGRPTNPDTRIAARRRRRANSFVSQRRTLVIWQAVTTDRFRRFASRSVGSSGG